MNQIKAFVGHSFAKEDEEVVRSFLDFFDSVKGMVIGFDWEHAKKTMLYWKEWLLIGYFRRQGAFQGVERFGLQDKHRSNIKYNVGISRHHRICDIWSQTERDRE